MKVKIHVLLCKDTYVTTFLLISMDSYSTALQTYAASNLSTSRFPYSSVSTYGTSRSPQIDLGPENRTIFWLEGALT